MYNYAQERENIFTERGTKLLLEIRDKVNKLLEVAGAVRFQEGVSGISGDTWHMLAVFDYLVEIGELRRVEQDNVCGQHEIYTRP